MILKRSVLALAAAASLSLAACATDPSTGLPVPKTPISSQTDKVTADKLQNIANQIVSGVRTACGFVVEATPAINIAATFLGAASISGVVTTAVGGICSALNSKGVRRGIKAPVYRGVPITGTRV